MPMAAPPLPDWLKVQDTLAQTPLEGVNVHARPQMVGQPQQYGMMAPEAYWGGGGGQAANVEAVPFGSLMDPVSQAAFLAAPGVQALARELLPQAGMSAPRLPTSFLAQQRGNLGRPPMSAAGEVLPESMVRDEAGNLQRLYHGTQRQYPDFAMSQSGTGAGGDLYGPGIYMTESPQIGSEYAQGEGYRMVTTRAEAESIAQSHGTEIIPVRIGNTITGYKVPVTQEGANIRPVYADLKRPFDMDGVVTSQDVARLREAARTWEGISPRYRAKLETLLDIPLPKEGLLGKDLMQDIADQAYQEKGATAYNVLGKAQYPAFLQQAGYDGITHLGGAITGGQSHRVYIAFSPENVYPSFNVDALRPPQ